MQKAQALVVEDEHDVRELMMLQLERNGIAATGAEDDKKALQVFKEKKPDLLVLDWMLPGQSGLEICKRVRQDFKSKVPILMVTARADVTDVVLGLEMGADDYLTKPFQNSVFVARVRALLRRSQQQENATPVTRYELGALKIDLESHKVHCGTETAQLTHSEFKALVALMRNRGLILSRPKMIELIQGEGIRVTERAIDTLIFGLRKNLGACSNLVETVRGVGYRIRAD